MQDVSATYRSIMAGPHWFESSLDVGDMGRLVTSSGETITFGGTSILVGRGGGDSGYQEDTLISMETVRRLFAGSSPLVGSCVAGEINVRMLNINVQIPRMAQIVPYIRICNDTEKSEWIQKGVFYIDTRSVEMDGGLEILVIHGYDAMLKADVEFPFSYVAQWPATDLEVVEGVADYMGVGIDPRTYDIMTNSYTVQMPTGYTAREVLGYVAAMYAGCWIFNDTGLLQLITLNGLPAQTNYLIDHTGDPITFGGDRILV